MEAHPNTVYPYLPVHNLQTHPWYLPFQPVGRHRSEQMQLLTHMDYRRRACHIIIPLRRIQQRYLFHPQF